ncbi:GDSL-LIKE LIPASE/ACYLHYDROLASE FAMILY PROTEIN EXPRESSED [Salix purpurea]|uniref:GDSL-LIKE LIPASE/ACYLHYDROLASE FAMILY PROTEIN EXPRESSED n=1 Tax=Salix purpurea TaxID=77065 RepID=A0A9Q1A8V8_SALPP|nr:GDSL-LIKE LIPASE/ACYLHYDROLASE FAMILY PROTEIN EXPRESSED [Salix purpurea]
MQVRASLSDTGNQIIEIPQVWSTKPPYGQAIHKVTGRASDGLLIIDYIAGGSAVLSTKFLAEKNISSDHVSSPLNVQLEWLDKYLQGFCHDAKEKLASSLFTTFAGGNDYGIALSQNKTIEEVKNSLVPDCVEALKQAVRKLIHHGARRVLCSWPFPGWLFTTISYKILFFKQYFCFLRWIWLSKEQQWLVHVSQSPSQRRHRRVKKRIPSCRYSVW